MSAPFGYKPRTFGAMAYPHSPGASAAGAGRYGGGIASALAGRSPLSNTSGFGGYAGYAALQAPKARPVQAYKPQPQAPAQPNAQAPTQPQAPAPGVYDLNTDPVLQQIQAFAGMGDEQARASAVAQKQQLLVGYGDPNLARTVLGDENYATAAGANPFSTLSQLAHQHDQGLHDLGEYYNSNGNLFYSGAHVLGEQEDARAYQQALADRASAVDQGLGGIDQGLSAALGANQQSRLQAGQDAYDRQLQIALAGGYDPGAAAGPGPNVPGDTTGAASGYGATSPPLTADDYLQALALAMAKRRAVAV